MDLSSEELLVQVATGDKRAFGELYDRLASRVMGICMQVLRNRAIAEEITQEVFVEIWRTAPMFSPERGSAQGWVLRLARSRAIDKLRSRMAALARDERTTMLEQLTRYIDVEEDAITSRTAPPLCSPILVGSPSNNSPTTWAFPWERLRPGSVMD